MLEPYAVAIQRGVRCTTGRFLRHQIVERRQVCEQAARDGPKP
jgi:hypothetical protein